MLPIISVQYLESYLEYSCALALYMIISLNIMTFLTEEVRAFLLSYTMF